MGEQGAESIHTAVNQIEFSYLNMPNKVDRVVAVIKEHHLRNDPEHRNLVPVPKKGKKILPEP